MSLQFFCKTKNNKEVLVDLENSHFATHLKDTPQLEELAKQVLQQIDVQGDFMEFEKDMGEVIGTTDEVETSEEDEIIYAKRGNRTMYTRFVKNKEPQPCSLVTVGLKKIGNNSYELHTAYIGKVSPNFPIKGIKDDAAREYWNKHALVWGTQEIQTGTQTKDIPW